MRRHSGSRAMPIPTVTISRMACISSTPQTVVSSTHLPLAPFAVGHVADEGGEQALLAHADGGDADFGGELAAVAAQGRDLEDTVEHRPLAGRQEASQAAPVSFAGL